MFNIFEYFDRLDREKRLENWENKFLNNPDIMKEIKRIVKIKPVNIDISRYGLSYRNMHNTTRSLSFSDLNLPELSEEGEYALTLMISKKLSEAQQYNRISDNYNNYSRPEGHNIKVDSSYKPKVKKKVTGNW